MAKKIAVLEFQPGWVRGCLVSVAKSKTEIVKEVQKEFAPHDFAQLSKALGEIKKELKVKSVRVLVPEQKAYLKLLRFPGNTELTRELVQEKSQESIPEILKDGIFDWRHVNDRDGQKQVQVMAVSEVYLKFIRQAAQGAGLQFIAFEPPSLSLARLVAEKGLVLVTRQAKESALVICEGGVVAASVFLNEGEDVAQKITSLKEHVKQELNLEVSQTIEEELDPVRGLALKEDLEGKDEKILNLPAKNTLDNISSLTPVGQEGEKMEGQPEAAQPQVNLNPTSTMRQTAKKGKSWLVWLVVGLVVIALGVGAYFIFFRGEGGSEPTSSDEVPTTAPIIKPTNQPEPTEAPVELDRSELSVQVLNGGGVAGAAGTMQEFLEGLGYVVADTGNADNFDYLKTELSIKAEHEAYITQLVADLGEEYSLADTVGEVDEDSEYDIVVILGQ